MRSEACSRFVFLARSILAHMKLAIHYSHKQLAQECLVALPGFWDRLYH